MTMTIYDCTDSLEYMSIMYGNTSVVCSEGYIGSGQRVDNGAKHVRPSMLLESHLQFVLL